MATIDRLNAIRLAMSSGHGSFMFTEEDLEKIFNRLSVGRETQTGGFIFKRTKAGLRIRIDFGMIWVAKNGKA